MSKIPFSVVSIFILSSITIGCNFKSSDSDELPFTPKVEKFVQIYVDEGGQKLKNWVDHDKVPQPKESLRQFKVKEGLEMQLVASDPTISQPIDMKFDEQGRLWVVQYKQYPFPAGLTINFYDQWLRAGFDGELLPPSNPNHKKGADRITVLEDTNGDGTFDSSKDVIKGLNIANSVLPDNGGVWVLSPPYLLFYPDLDGDGLPDGKPEVHLDGFGLQDTHGLANSLEWGPDGWIYGVQGSTTMSKVKEVSIFGPGLWRYKPETSQFELFSDGGSNLFTLNFDSRGQAFSGMNGSQSRGEHWVQGGNFEKGISKHGPFTEPYVYGRLGFMDHKGYKKRFSMTLSIYEDGKLPGYEGQMVSGMAMTNRIQASKLIPQGSTFRTVDTDSLVTTSDRSFRPVDIEVGPDGAVYIADWCDIRMDHVDPRDTWDSCGRIWRLQPKDYQPIKSFNLAKLSNEDLIDMLSDKRKWYRSQARRLLGARKNSSLVRSLQKLTEQKTGQTALEALWATHLMEGNIDQEWALQLLDHSNNDVRYWTIRLMGDDKGSVKPKFRQKLVELAREDPSAEVRSQLASTSKRLVAEDALPILRGLITRTEDIDDKYIPLLIWWALEDKMDTDYNKVEAILKNSDIWQEPLFKQYIIQLIARRVAAERGDTPSYTRKDPYKNWMEYAHHPRSTMPKGKGDYTPWVTNYTPKINARSMNRINTLLNLAPDTSSVRSLLSGIKAGLSQGPVARGVPQSLRKTIDNLWIQLAHTEPLVSVTSQLGGKQDSKKAQAIMVSNKNADKSKGSVASSKAQRGNQLFLTHCSVCHQSNGSGMEGLAASLQRSKNVLGPIKKLTRIALNGLKGEIGLMPPQRALEDEEIADILTYIRSAWGNEAGPVSPETVKQIRKEVKDRNKPWTNEELSNISTN